MTNLNLLKKLPAKILNRILAWISKPR